MHQVLWTFLKTSFNLGSGPPSRLFFPVLTKAEQLSGALTCTAHMEDELLPAHSRRRLFSWTAKNQLPIHAQLHHSRWYQDSCILGDYHNGKSISISKPLKTDSNFSHLIHVKPHTTDYLRTWVSLSHQANNMLLFLLLVLQFGNLPRVVIKEEEKKNPRNVTKKTWRCSKWHLASPMPCKRGKRHSGTSPLGSC